MRLAFRGCIAASLLAALVFNQFHLTLEHTVALIALKGAAVALLALAALVGRNGVRSRRLALILALGAAGDVAIEFGLAPGAACFLAGHLVATPFYMGHRRSAVSTTQKALAILLPVIVPLVALQLPADRTTGILAAVYSLALAAMASTAWLSRFSRYSVGLGAMLFVASDLLIFARLGPLAQSPLPNLLVWPLYYFGQYLICLGVLRGLQPATGNRIEPSASYSSGP